MRLFSNAVRSEYFSYTTAKPRADLASSLFPKGLLEETLQTLKLLFPGSDGGLDAWLRKHAGDKSWIDGEMLKCGRLSPDDRHIEKFHFWRDRLVILKELFDEARPTTLSQWWLDRRDGVRWYTFWVAILVLCLTLLFGLIQCIEGGLQAYKAYHPTVIVAN
jgi:hypothetical protein